MTRHNYGLRRINPPIEVYKPKKVVGNIENHVFVVVKRAAGSGKMLVEVNVATAPTHINNEQIINAICDSGMTHFAIHDFYKFHGEGFTKFLVKSSTK